MLIFSAQGQSEFAISYAEESNSLEDFNSSFKDDEDERPKKFSIKIGAQTNVLWPFETVQNQYVNARIMMGGQTIGGVGIGISMSYRNFDFEFRHSGFNGQMPKSSAVESMIENFYPDYYLRTYNSSAPWGEDVISYQFGLSYSFYAARFRFGPRIGFLIYNQSLVNTAYYLKEYGSNEIMILTLGRDFPDRLELNGVYVGASGSYYISKHWLLTLSVNLARCFGNSTTMVEEYHQLNDVRHSYRIDEEVQYSGMDLSFFINFTF